MNDSCMLISIVAMQIGGFGAKFANRVVFLFCMTIALVCGAPVALCLKLEITYFLVYIELPEDLGCVEKMLVFEDPTVILARGAVQCNAAESVRTSCHSRLAKADSK